MLEICGSNDHFQLDEESNNKDLQYGYSAISPSKKSRLEASSISSYSSYYYQTVVITKDSKLLASGSNKDHQIIGSLANEDLKKFTKFDIKIDNDHLLYPISAVCGYNYTLYLASITVDSHEKHLFYSFAGIKSENPLFLSIGDSNPVSLFGGFSSAASIDTEGFVIFISLSSQESKPSELERNHLPNSDAAVCVACCVDFIYAVGLSGQLFESKPPKPGSSKLNFRPVESLNALSHFP